MRLSAQLIVCDKSDYRISPRDEVNAPSTLRLYGGEAADVHIRDLSASGCFVESSMNLAVNDPIRIGLAGSGTIKGRLVRLSASGFAVMFNRALSDGELEGAFSGPEIIQPLNQPGIDMVSGDEHVRWPRPIRAIIVLGSAAALWAVIITGISSF
jgi:hypothetical protein